MYVLLRYIGGEEANNYEVVGVDFLGTISERKAGGRSLSSEDIYLS